MKRPIYLFPNKTMGLREFAEFRLSIGLPLYIPDGGATQFKNGFVFETRDGEEDD